ncbi:hypothetical protein P3T36_000162 [Kitasatospora sp. MAP12-15]|uniref:hypothetical protein n=1 Tax=unclassified Kitasatospora TaxID=2633591 RepID=UPI002474212A|nr:hypothetical protein [Kitasatospora sp. MAP12-44]MDH6109390.1 hypothetical protein [Kitasatospora sp. MAP12-44]
MNTSKMVLLGTVAAGLAVALTLPTGSAQSHPAPPGQARQQRPAPHIMDFAQGLPVQARQQARPAAGTPVRIQAGADGCDHAYGDISVCVPWTLPADAGTAPGDGCRWLLAHGYPALAVHGRDRLHLDTNHDGTACDHGDAGV